MIRRVCSFILLAAVGQMASADQVFRGFDAGIGAGALVSFPNSDLAQTGYLAAASAVQTQDFEGLGLGGVPGNWTFSGGLNAAYSSQASVGSSIATGLGASQTYASNGTRYLYSETAPGSGFFTLNFASSVNGIGFYFSDAADWLSAGNAPAPIYIELLDANNGVLQKYDLFTQSPSTIASGDMMYFGVVSDVNFNGFRIVQPVRGNGATNESDAIGFDQFSVSVPTPGAVGVLALGGLPLSRRRR